MTCSFLKDSYEHESSVFGETFEKLSFMALLLAISNSRKGHHCTSLGYFWMFIGHPSLEGSCDWHPFVHPHGDHLFGVLISGYDFGPPSRSSFWTDAKCLHVWHVLRPATGRVASRVEGTDRQLISPEPMERE